jgi:hypothetical protein
VWTGSYLLYVLYTSSYLAYDVLPGAVGMPDRLRPVVALLVPAGLAAVLLAPSRVAWAAIGVAAVAQLLPAALLAVGTTAHAVGHPALLAAGPGAPALADAGLGIGLLYVCGSLPLFFASDVPEPARRLPRAMVTGFAVSALLVTVTVAALATEPAFLRAAVPGASFAATELGPAAGTVVGLGVAVSDLGVLLVEALALVRLGHAVTGRPRGRLAAALAVTVVASGPISLLEPEQFYRWLLRPSLVMLWIALLVPAAVYPWFAARRGRLRAGHVLLAAAPSAVMVLGLITSAQQGS